MDYLIRTLKNRVYEGLNSEPLFASLSSPALSFALSLFDVLNLASSSIADMREPKLAAEIARQLHKFHQVDIPGSKEPQLWNDIFKFFENGIFSDFNLLP